MSTYSTNLKVQLIGTGEENGTWGSVTNNAFSNVFEQAIVGYATVNFATDANTTLTLADGNSSQTARNLYLNLTSSGSLTATRDLILPNNQAGTAPIQKLYIVKNATTGGRSIQVKTASGTGVTIPNGATMLVYSNGTDVVDVITNITSLTLTNALPVASGGTGVTTSTGSGSVVLSNSGTLTTPRLAGSSTGYSTFASANASTTNYTITFPAETMTTGFRNIPPIGSKTSSYTLAVSDVAKYVQIGSGGSITVPNSVFADGDIVIIFNNTSTDKTITTLNQISVAYIAGTTTNRGGVSGANITLAGYGVATVLFTSSTSCVISGNVS